MYEEATGGSEQHIETVYNQKRHGQKHYNVLGYQEGG